MTGGGRGGWLSYSCCRRRLQEGVGLLLFARSVGRDVLAGCGRGEGIGRQEQEMTGGQGKTLGGKGGVPRTGAYGRREMPRAGGVHDRVEAEFRTERHTEA